MVWWEGNVSWESWYVKSSWLHHGWTSTTIVQVCEFMMHVLLSVWRHCFNWRGCLTSCSTGPYLWWQKCAKNDDWCLVMFQRTCNWTWLCSLPRRWHETTSKQSEENKRREVQLMQVAAVGECFWWFLSNICNAMAKTLFCNYMLWPYVWTYVCTNGQDYGQN